MHVKLKYDNFFDARTGNINIISVSLEQTGHVYTVSGNDIFPIARIHVSSKFASALVEKYCEIDGYFTQTARASSSAPPAKKPARKTKGQIHLSSPKNFWPLDPEFEY